MYWIQNETYQFIRQIILPAFDWPDFVQLAVQYQQNRPLAGRYVDMLPAVATLAVGGDRQQAVPLAASWTLFVLSARMFDDLLDDEGHDHGWRQSETAVSTTGLFAIGAANVALLASCLSLCWPFCRVF